MIRRILDAIYENGTFRPLGDTKGIGEHAHARVLVCNAESASKRSELRGTLTRDEALRQMDVIDAEFGQVVSDRLLQQCQKLIS